MMSAPNRDPAGPVAKNAEQQMRRWALGLEIQQRIEHDRAVAQLSKEIHPFLAISRETGAGGSAIAQRVGERLGWDVLDSELIRYMAERYELPQAMLEFLDETTSNWLYEVFGKWIDRHVVTQSEYVDHLARIILMAARHGSCVFVGRGAQFVLPRQKGLAVRIVAPHAQRVSRIMQLRQLSADQARTYIKESDEGREDFVRRYFHHETFDPHLYDLVVNMEKFTVEEAAELIENECRKRLPNPDPYQEEQTANESQRRK